MNILIYTDGSCHTRLLIGTWAAIVFVYGKKIVLNGGENETTHNRMELMAVIRAIEYTDDLNLNDCKLLIHSDSQYVVNLPLRLNKLLQNNFITKKGDVLANADLLAVLIQQIRSHQIEFKKIKAHQKNGDAHNREVDMLVRNLLREMIND
ncbi:MAG: ribonuclease H [Bacteroidota bacterium]